MKILILLCFFVNYAWAQCSSISRTNASGTLTSTKYNGDINTVYNFVNSYDGGCIQGDSIQKGALNSSDFDPFLNTGKQGCKLAYVDSNTIGVSACKIGVDGNLISTTSQTNVTWNCPGCSAEATATYYLYAQSAATLSLVMSTTSPNDAGYNGVNRVLGKFDNNSSLNIVENSIRHWNGTTFEGNSNSQVIMTGDYSLYYAKVDGSQVVSNENTEWISGNCSGANVTTCSFNSAFSAIPFCWVQGQLDGSDSGNTFCWITGAAGAFSTTQIRFSCTDHAGANTSANYIKHIFCLGK